MLITGLVMLAFTVPLAISAAAGPAGNQEAATANPIGTPVQVVPVVVPSASPPSAPAPRPRSKLVTPQTGVVPSSLEATGVFSTPVDPVAALPGGQLMIPSDAQRVGWWSAGAAPGDAEGSVVLVGHLDTPRGGLGVFYHLLDLTAGQPVVVKDSSGRRHSYTVVSREQIARTSLPASLFDGSGPPRLVLITCGGNYDRKQHRYDDNTIVVAAPD